MVSKKKKKKGKFRYFLLFLAVITFLYITLSIYIENLIKKEISQTFGSDLLIGKMLIQPIHLKFKEVRLKDPYSKKILFKADSIFIRPHLKTILKKRLVISQIKIYKPYTIIEVSKDGKIRTPFVKLTSKKNKEKEKKRFKIYIKRIRLINGEVDFINRQTLSPYHKIQLSRLNAKIDDILIPRPYLNSKIDLNGLIKGKRKDGSFRFFGWINFDNKNTETKLSVRGLDLKLLEPYYKKNVKTRIEYGLLDANSLIKIKDAKLNAPGIIRLRELKIKPDSHNRKFLGVSSHRLLTFLKDNNGSIDLEFNIEGDIRNPRFSIRDSLIRKLGESIGRKLGSPIRAAEKVIKKTGKKGAEFLKGLKSAAKKVEGFLKRLINPKGGD